MISVLFTSSTGSGCNPSKWFVVLFPLQVLYIAILLSVMEISSVALLIGCGLGSFLIESNQIIGLLIFGLGSLRA